MRKLQLLVVAFLLCVGCEKERKEPTDAVQEEVAYEYGKMPKKEPVSQEAAEILNAWEAFSEFSRSVDILYRATSSEDLSLAMEDVIAKEKLLAESEYPATFDVPQIKSRQQVLRTFLLKAKGDLDGRRNPTSSMMQLFDAYNAMRSQFIIITSNTLELNLFLNDE
ncbi:MAG: hypothetical protein ED555_02725 [Allomuricauda sp.]|nr:MAG: hypothetical protein ED555_02725 [Allomuricauda sp.]